MKYNDVEKVVAEVLEVISVIKFDPNDQESFDKIVYYTFHRMKKWEDMNEKVGHSSKDYKLTEAP